jgi:pyruvate kinase
LKSKKELIYKYKKISLPAMTEKILQMLFCHWTKCRLDCIIFCKTPRDLQDLQELIAEHSEYKIPIIAK